MLAAEITTSTVDWSQLDPMVSAAIGELEQAGVERPAADRAADAQYWNEEHMDEVIANKHVQVLIPPESRTRDSPGRAGRADAMTSCAPCSAASRPTALPTTASDDRAGVRSTPNTTAVSPGSSAEAGPRYAPNGDY